MKCGKICAWFMTLCSLPSATWSGCNLNIYSFRATLLLQMDVHIDSFLLMCLCRKGSDYPIAGCELCRPVTLAVGPKVCWHVASIASAPSGAHLHLIDQQLLSDCLSLGRLSILPLPHSTLTFCAPEIKLFLSAYLDHLKIWLANFT